MNYFTIRKKVRNFILGFSIAFSILFIFFFFISKDFLLNDIIPEQQIKILLICLSGAIFEEYIFTYIIFSFLNNNFRLFYSILFTSLFFALIHLGNSNSTLTSVISHFIGSNIYILAFIKSKDIFLSIGLHLGWNYAQVICSQPMSDTLREGIFSINLPINEFWLGSNYGIESGFSSLILRLTILLIFILSFEKMKK